MSRHNTEHSTKHLCVIFLKFFFFIAQHVFLGTVWSFFFLCCSLPWSLIIHNINKCLTYTPSGFVLIDVLAIFPVNANCWRFTYCDYFVTMLPFINHKLMLRFLFHATNVSLLHLFSRRGHGEVLVAEATQLLATSHTPARKQQRAREKKWQCGLKEKICLARHAKKKNAKLCLKKR